MGFIRLIFASVFTEIYVRKLSNIFNQGKPQIVGSRMGRTYNQKGWENYEIRQNH